MTDDGTDHRAIYHTSITKRSMNVVLRAECWTDPRIVVVVVFLLMHAASELSNCYLYRLLSFEDDSKQLQYLQVGFFGVVCVGFILQNLGSEESAPFMRRRKKVWELSIVVCRCSLRIFQKLQNYINLGFHVREETRRWHLSEVVHDGCHTISSLQVYESVSKRVNARNW